ncbi:MAG: AtpZ/AtpI family protein [Candidatus Saccharimonadales bacterium]
MKQEAADKTTQLTHGNRASILGAIGGDVLDTAWRMALPILLFAVGGILFDRHFKTSPWVTLAATFVGLVLSGLLVKRQIAALEKKEQL